MENLEIRWSSTVSLLPENSGIERVPKEIQFDIITVIHKEKFGYKPVRFKSKHSNHSFTTKHKIIATLKVLLDWHFLLTCSELFYNLHTRQKFRCQRTSDLIHSDPRGYNSPGESEMLSEVSQTEIQILYDICYMCNLKNSTTESVYKTERDSYRKQTYSYQRGGSRRNELGVGDYSYK